MLGRHSVWFGDCMRRDPDKRDAFTCFVTGSADTVVQTRATFQRVWAAAIPIYVHRLPSADASVQPQLEPEAVQQSNQSRGLLPGSLETLEAWQVSTRH